MRHRLDGREDLEQLTPVRLLLLLEGDLLPDVLGQAMPEVAVRLLVEARHLRVDGGAYLLAPDLGRLVRVRV